MPALYGSINEFETTALGEDLQPLWTGRATATMHRMLAQASDQVDRCCKRKLGAPPQTTVGTAGVAAGARSIPLSSAVNIYPLDVLLFPSSGESVQVQGADVSDWTDTACPGSAPLTSPLQSGYAGGTTVQVYRQDRYRVRGHATRPGDADVSLSPQGQLAQMHAPMISTGDWSRVVFLPEYPVLSLSAAYQSLPYGNTETPIDFSSVYLEQQERFFRLPVGYYNPVGCIWRVQYSAGYAVIPYDLRDAAYLYLAARLVRGQNPLGASSLRQGDVSWANPGSTYAQEAERILKDGGYRRSWS